MEEDNVIEEIPDSTRDLEIDDDRELMLSLIHI